MGIAKSYWMDRMQDEAWEDRAEWIREKLNDPDADEFSAGWAQLSEEYDNEHQFDDYDRYEDDWIVEGKDRLEIFDENIEATREILATVISQKYEKNSIVMLFGHVVAAVEAYLSSAFIHYTLSSEEHMRRLVENDPEFAKRMFWSNGTGHFNKRQYLSVIEVSGSIRPEHLSFRDPLFERCKEALRDRIVMTISPSTH